MKKIVITLLAVAFASGCASSATDERLSAIESQLASVQQTADQALDLAQEAQSKSSGMSSDVGDAQRMARQAMDTATETAERVSRMASECCGGK